MKHVRMTLVLIAAVGLSACASEHEAATKDNQTIAKTTIPVNLSNSRIVNEFPVPPAATAAASGKQKVSLIPPGSDLQRFTKNAKKKIALTAQAGPTKTIVQANESFFLAVPSTQAWSKVGDALKSSGYQVLDQDSALGAYYILDKSATGGAVQRNTPIYQVQLTKQANGTIVSLLNSNSQPATDATGKKVLAVLKKKLIV